MVYFLSRCRAYNLVQASWGLSCGKEGHTHMHIHLAQERRETKRSPDSRIPTDFDELILRVMPLGSSNKWQHWSSKGE
jgi:hypothetical protein